MKRKLYLTLLTLALPIAGCGAEEGAILASGFIESRAVVLSTSVGGRVTTVHAEAGDLVAQGQTVLVLDDSEARAGFVAAEAARAAAEAELSRLESLPGAAQVAALQAEIAAAQSELAAAEDLVDLLQGGPAKALQEAGLAAEIARLELQLARAELAALQAGPPPGRIAMAEARLHEAEANLNAAELLRSWYTLQAPLAGLVAESFAAQGEVVPAGAPLMKLIEAGSLRLTVFLTESERAKVEREDLVLITVEAHPGEVFPGIVERVAAEAEFTPSEIEIAEQRVRTVFRVVIAFSDFGGKLKPGMSAEAEFMP